MFQISWLPLNTFNVTLINRSVYNLEFSSVQTLCRVWLFETPWIAAGQASLSISNSPSSLKLMSIESVMPSSHLIVSCPLLLLPPIPPSVRVFSNKSALGIRWSKYWSFRFKILHSMCQHILEIQPWLQDWKISVLIQISKKGNAKEWSNWSTVVALISHASKIVVGILQARLQ